jgi:hypothetical protein
MWEMVTATNDRVGEGQWRSLGLTDYQMSEGRPRSSTNWTTDAVKRQASKGQAYYDGAKDPVTLSVTGTLLGFPCVS